ncbi:MAG: hypothetical protein KJS98_11555, partial [Nitrospirae bacterium]|nr:hypothetical protein [Nitrospirota bacterium]
DARHDGDVDDRWSGLLVSGIASASIHSPLEQATAWCFPLSQLGRQRRHDWRAIVLCQAETAAGI